jgi:hypothetical protein
MPTVAIPDWSPQGVLPPINPLSTTSADRSPYEVTLLDLVMRFATSKARCQILDGFLTYRRELHTMGLHQGFQWIDGSFAEHVELLETRDPKDVDVVTFLHIPDPFTPTSQQDLVLDHDHVKAMYRVDAYIVEINLLPPDNLIKQSTYWYSMWSHRRNQTWKGYLQVDLSSAEDANAQAWLAAHMAGELAP